MTIEEVIKKLKARIDDDFVNDEPYPYDLKIAIEALEKQAPKKPTLIEDKMYMCPVCYNNLMFKWAVYPTVKNTHIGLRFCLGCGQAIDWGEVNAE